MINIPDKVKVGGLTYTIDVVDKIDDDTCAAFMDTQKLQIKIEKAEPQAMQHNFLHELIHCINSEVSEKDVEFMTMLLHQIVVDNPLIFGGGEQNI